MARSITITEARDYAKQVGEDAVEHLRLNELVSELSKCPISHRTKVLNAFMSSLCKEIKSDIKLNIDRYLEPVDPTLFGYKVIKPRIRSKRKTSKSKTRRNYDYY